VGGTEGYACFRIPALVTAADGTLLAFAEGRKHGCSDTGDIDLVMKRSRDGGLTWSKLRVVWDDADNVCGNPAPVLDRQTGRILLLCTWNLGEDHERQIIEGKSKDTRRIFILHTENAGSSWSIPREITYEVKHRDWTWYATGPCHGIQVEKGPYRGRLVIPCDHIERDSKKYYSHVIYSDDHGASWQAGSRTPRDQVNECTVAELHDGLLLLNMRNYDRSQENRKVALSANGGKSWGSFRSDTSLIEPICQASMLSVPQEGQGPLLFFLNPAHRKERRLMTLRMSSDAGQSWERSWLLHEGPAAYSDLTLVEDGLLGCLYEAGRKRPYEAIVFRTFEFAP
jgi:sialidase-1